MSNEDFTGKLTGYRCKECGCCLFQNNIGNVWCSSCDFSKIIYDDISKYFTFVEIPEWVKEYWKEYL